MLLYIDLVLATAVQYVKQEAIENFAKVYLLKPVELERATNGFAPYNSMAAVKNSTSSSRSSSRDHHNMNIYTVISSSSNSTTSSPTRARNPHARPTPA